MHLSTSDSRRDISCGLTQRTKLPPIAEKVRATYRRKQCFIPSTSNETFRIFSIDPKQKDNPSTNDALPQIDNP